MDGAAVPLNYLTIRARSANTSSVKSRPETLPKSGKKLRKERNTFVGVGNNRSGVYRRQSRRVRSPAKECQQSRRRFSRTPLSVRFFRRDGFLPFDQSRDPILLIPECPECEAF